MRRWLFTALALGVLGVASTADFDSPIISARFEADNYAPLTGAPFRIALRVELTPNTSVVEWPQITDPWGPFEVRTVEPVVQDGNVVSQSFEMVLWLPQDAVTPPTFIGYGAGGGDIRRVPVTEAFFSVPTVLETGAETPVPPVPLPPVFWPWPLLVLAAGVALAGVIIAGPRLRHQRAEVTPPDPIEVLARSLARQSTSDPLESARAVMRAVQQAGTLGLESDALTRVRDVGEALLYRAVPVSSDEAEDLRRLALRAISELRDG